METIIKLKILTILFVTDNSFQASSSKGTKTSLRPLFIAVVILILWFVIYLPLTYSPRPQPPDTSWMLLHQDLHQYVNPNNNTIIIEPNLNCNSSSSSKIFLVVIVCSSLSNFAARQAIRETWASATTKINDTKVYFLLGKSENEVSNAAVMEESKNHSDVIQHDFLDTYNNLTVKSTMLLKWVNNSCQTAQYVMKTDDDMLINLPNLVKYLKTSGHKHMLLGCLISDAIPIKDWHSKWYVPDDVFSDHKYPNYLSGTGYVMSNDIVPLLYKTSLSTPFFYLEDVFITGICARKAKIKPINHNGFKFYKRKNDPCIFRKIITGHKMSVSELRTIWRKMNNPSIKCIKKSASPKQKS